MEKDVETLMDGVSENFISVNNGRINYPSLKDMRNSFTNYFDNTEFLSYIDLNEPIIGFSDDAKTTWSIVRVKVQGKSKKENSIQDMDFVCAWITLYRRENQEWVRFIEVSSSNKTIF
jgi:hypothetical protein